VVIGNEVNFAALLPRQVLEEYDYTLLSPRITPEVVVVGNIGVEIYSSIPAIVYNSELVPAGEAPRTLEDALDPRWRGKLAATPYVTPLDRVSMHPQWGADRMKGYVTRLSENLGGLIRIGEESRIVTAEFLMLVMGNIHNTRMLQRQGAPLGYIVPLDAAISSSTQFGVPRNSAHPHLAKLYINTVLSEEGQRVLWDLFGTDHHRLPGSQAAADVAELKARGSDISHVDVKLVLERPEMLQIVPEFEKILAGQRAGQ
jgi:iron(III) transport system substrate-binding protein